MRVFTVKWKPHKDETTVFFSNEYKDFHWIEKLDVLKDAINILDEEYEKVLKGERYRENSGEKL